MITTEEIEAIARQVAELWAINPDHFDFDGTERLIGHLSEEDENAVLAEAEWIGAIDLPSEKNQREEIAREKRGMFKICPP